MRILTRCGLFAAECVRDGTRLDAEEVRLHARTLGELERFKELFPRLGLVETHDSGWAGFAVALKLPKAMWSRALETLALDMDYSGPTPGQMPVELAPGIRAPKRRAASRSPRLRLVRGGADARQASLWAA